MVPNFTSFSFQLLSDEVQGVGPMSSLLHAVCVAQGFDYTFCVAVDFHQSSEGRREVQEFLYFYCSLKLAKCREDLVSR